MANATRERKVARWESKGGTYWFELSSVEHGYSYCTSNGFGFFHASSDEDAIRKVGSRVAASQPDRNKTPMVRKF